MPSWKLRNFSSIVVRQSSSVNLDVNASHRHYGTELTEPAMLGGMGVEVVRPGDETARNDRHRRERSVEPKRTQTRLKISMCVFIRSLVCMHAAVGMQYHVPER